MCADWDNKSEAEQWASYKSLQGLLRQHFLDVHLDVDDDDWLIYSRDLLDAMQQTRNQHMLIPSQVGTRHQKVSDTKEGGLPKKVRATIEAGRKEEDTEALPADKGVESGNSVSMKSWKLLRGQSTVEGKMKTILGGMNNG